MTKTIVTRTRKTVAALMLGAALTSAATAEQECELFSPISIDQAKELKAKMLSEESDELDIIDAYETMRCAERETFRTLARTTALESASKALKTQIVGDLFLSKEVIVVELSADESANPLALKSVTDNPTFTSEVNRVYPEANKITTRNSCADDISYDSQAIDISLGCSSARNISGRLVFDGNAFVGTLRLVTAEKAVGAINGRVGLIN